MHREQPKIDKAKCRRYPPLEKFLRTPMITANKVQMSIYSCVEVLMSFLSTVFFSAPQYLITSKRAVPSEIARERLYEIFASFHTCSTFTQCSCTNRQ